jgi:hypothetical protein
MFILPSNNTCHVELNYAPWWSPKLTGHQEGLIGYIEGPPRVPLQFLTFVEPMVASFLRLLAFTVLIIFYPVCGLNDRFERPLRSKLLKTPRKPNRTIRSFDSPVERCFSPRPIEMRNLEDRHSGSRHQKKKEEIEWQWDVMDTLRRPTPFNNSKSKQQVRITSRKISTKLIIHNKKTTPSMR